MTSIKPEERPFGCWFSSYLYFGLVYSPYDPPKIFMVSNHNGPWLVHQHVGFLNELLRPLAASTYNPRAKADPNSEVSWLCNFYLTFSFFILWMLIFNFRPISQFTRAVRLTQNTCPIINESRDLLLLLLLLQLLKLFRCLFIWS